MEGRSYLRTRCCGVDVASSFSVDYGSLRRCASRIGSACRLNTAPELPNNRQYRLVSCRIAPLLMPCFVPLGLPGVWDDWGRVVVDRVCGHVAGVRRE